MKEEEFNVNKIDSLANKFLLLAFSLVMFYLSVIFRTRGGVIRLSIFNYFNTIAYSIFAVMHALHLFIFMRQNEKKVGVLDYISYVFLFFAFYSVVLLPASGFAMAEWLVVTFYLFPGLVSAITPLKENGRVYRIQAQNPLLLMSVGILMMLFKVMLWWTSPDNLYLSTVAGNKSLRMALVVLCAAGIFVLVNQWMNRNRQARESKGKVAEGIQKGVKAVSQILSSIWSFVLTIFSGPVILIIICILILIFIICAALFANGVINDIQDIIEPFLDKMLTTGQDSVIKSKFYTICQVSAFVGCTVFQIILMLNTLTKNPEGETLSPEGTPIGQNKKTSIKEKSRKQIEEVKTPEVIHLGTSNKIHNS